MGQKLVYRLLKEPTVEVIATSKGVNRIMLQKGYIYKSLDITNKQEVEDLLQLCSPDVVINTAALTNVDACETQIEECHKLNVDAVRYPVDALGKLQNNPQIIHLSTDLFFMATGVVTGRPIFLIHLNRCMQK